MNGSLLLWLLLAITIFWSVGVYNRLMRMRARGLDAFGSVEKHMKQYGVLVQGHLALIDSAGGQSGGSVSEHLPEAWCHLLGALTALEQAIKDARATPLAVATLSALAERLDALQQAWEPLRNAPADLAGAVVDETVQKQWDAVTLKVQSSRGGLNQILARYNEAIAQFPARLVVGFMGFQAAGTL